MDHNETITINVPEFARFVRNLFASLIIVGGIGTFAGSLATFVGSLIP